MREINTGIFVGGLKDGQQEKYNIDSRIIRIPIKPEFLKIVNKNEYPPVIDMNFETYIIEFIRTEKFYIKFYRYEKLYIEQAICRILFYYKNKSIK